MEGRYFIWYTFGKEYYRLSYKSFSTVLEADDFAKQEAPKEFWFKFQILPYKEQPA